MSPLRLDWWRQAFAIPAPPPWDSESVAARQLDWLAQQTVDRGLAVPAVMLLESVRPLQGGAARLLPFFEPLSTTVATAPSPWGGTDWTRLLEHPGALDWLISRIEQRDPTRAHSPTTIGQSDLPVAQASVPNDSAVSRNSEIES
jgi:hypothetical protein